MKPKSLLVAVALVLLAAVVLLRQATGPDTTGQGPRASGERLLNPELPIHPAREGGSPGRQSGSGPVRFADRLGERAQLRRQTFLTAASVLVGRTVDPAGEALSGVALELTGTASSDTPSQSFSGQTVSSGDGGFRLDLPDSFGGWLEARAEGYAPVRQPIWSGGPGELHRVVVLNPKSGPLRVVVHEVFSRQRVSRALVEADLLRPEPADEKTHFECRTGETGECVLTDLPARRPLRVMASKRGHFEAVKQIQPAPQPASLSMAIIAGPTLLLQVRDLDRQPITGARVLRPDGLMAGTDREGRVWMPVIDELTTVQVRVSASGYRSREALIANDGSEQIVELEPAPMLRGMVMDPDRSPLPGVHVSIRKRIRGDAWQPESIYVAQRSGVFEEETLTDRDGFFEIPLPGDSAASLVAQRQGFQEWTFFLGDEENRLPEPLQIMLQPFSSVVLGQTLDPAGVPLPAQVLFTLVEPANGNLTRRSAEARGGFYLIGNLLPGTYLVVASTSVPADSGITRYQSRDYYIEVADGSRFQQDLRLEPLEESS